MNPFLLLSDLTFAPVLGVLVLLLICYMTLSRNKMLALPPLPPSPRQFPLVGALPFVRMGALHDTFSQWARQFGKIFSCRLGPQTYIVLNDVELVKQVLSNTSEIFNGRPFFFLIEMARKSDEPFSNGIVLNEGKAWKLHRSFVLKTFRSFGVGKSEFENVVIEEAAAIVDDFKRENSQPFDNALYLKKAVSNAISYMLFGTRFSVDDKNFQELVDFIECTAEENMASAAILNSYPWLRHFPPFRTNYEKLRKGVQDNYIRTKSLITSRVERTETDEVKSYTDAFLDNIVAEKSDENDGNCKYFTEFQLWNCLGDLFAAGFASTAATLRWALLYLALHPNVQRKIQEDIDEHVGRERFISLIDKSALSYLEATIMEVQRLGTVVPFAIPRRALQDTIIAGYHIPKSAVIMPNIWFIHHDPHNFPEPELFKPERFLHRDGTVLVPDAFLPFSIGIRNCPGESLAKMELFLLLGTILQNFHVNLPSDVEVNLRPKPGSAYDTLPYKMIAIPR